MAQTVGDIISRAKRILQERGQGVRWTDSELIGWLNEAYVAVAVQRPDAHARVGMIDLQAGARQTLPADGLRLMEVLSGESGRAIRETSRRTLATMRPNWQAEEADSEFEFYLHDDLHPAVFWVYPPALAGARVEASYVATPAQHNTASLSAVEASAISVSDRYATALLDFVLYRAFAKDAEAQANQARSQGHYQAFAAAMGGKVQGDTLIGGTDDA
ncbi:hypothetical protein HPA02_08350 [Bisbaumannia pacifica]|uniref:Uncharacterized protein n=1 Tax=Bisbaumannia pacifica TaxID=77098 RepID=A0A510X546_9GAMM|nr:DUF6682 family protein [Halomonas pacifica]GEK46552.1 hypothetical protein HPA02_08350 [Halomonas pacifica]